MEDLKKHRSVRDRSPDQKSKKSSRHRSAEKSSSSASHKHKRRSRSRSVERTKKKSKKRKERHRDRSSSSSDSSSESESERRQDKYFEKVEQERQRLKEERRKAKELMKAMETPEQKRLRRLAKKQMKERKLKADMGWDEEYMGYTNTDNPFGDANLLKTFKWDKKLEKEGLKDVPEDLLEQRNRQKAEENKRELEKVKLRRLEREREREQRDEEMQRVQRDKEAAQFQEWEKQEDIFHLQQAKLRSKIRIEEGRAKPIDLLAKYISAEEEDFSVEMLEPYTYLNGLIIDDLEDLKEDIRVYMELESSRNLDYWNDISIIVEEELRKLRKYDSEQSGVVDRREGINAAVTTDVIEVFRGKTPGQLEALHQQIEQKLSRKQEGVDVAYWETLLSRLKAFMARARLRERHQENLRRKLFQLKQEQGVQSAPLFPCVKVESDEAGPSGVSSSRAEDATTSTTETIHNDPNSSQDSSQNSEAPQRSEVDQEEEQEDDPIKIAIDAYHAGNYSPRLSRDVEAGTLITEPIADDKRLEFSRSQVLGTGRTEDIMTQEEKAFQREARKGMDDNEVSFGVEERLEPTTYLWSDKYRPRKPRYFNRVHTGFEWNKYNQTHYDMDNPPPKIVQGYKFNIFYPDLITKSKTPEYFLTPCEDNPDFCILRFHAGPPYEDIAFKVVNREWEYSYKRGFRCQFHNNIFQLWFHFKRYRYRR